MPDEKAIVEVVATEGELKAPIGIVSVKQALEMPHTEGVEYSYLEHEAGVTGVFATQDQLAKLP
jgi:hypothetical protein